MCHWTQGRDRQQRRCFHNNNNNTTDGDPLKGRLVKLGVSHGLQGQRGESDDGWLSGCSEDSSVECRLLQESDPRSRGLHPPQSDGARLTITYEWRLGSMELGVSAIVPRTQ